MLTIGARSPWNLPSRCCLFGGSTPGHIVWYVRHTGGHLGAGQRGAERLQRDILPACHHKLVGIRPYKRVRVWAEICVYERAGVQLAKEPRIAWPIRLGGLALGCPSICLNKRGSVGAGICLHKRAGVCLVKEPGIWGAIRPGGLAREGPGVCLDRWVGVWPAVEPGISGLIHWCNIHTRQLSNLACQCRHQYGELNYPIWLRMYFFLCCGAARVLLPLRGYTAKGAHGHWVHNHVQPPSWDL